MDGTQNEDVVLRVTGAGTVVIRLHPKGEPDEPLTVRRADAQWHECHGLAHRSTWACKLRGWAPPDFYPELTVRAKGYRGCIVESVTVRDDGPTYLDVELEAR